MIKCPFLPLLSLLSLIFFLSCSKDAPLSMHCDTDHDKSACIENSGKTAVITCVAGLWEYKFCSEGTRCDVSSEEGAIACVKENCVEDEKRCSDSADKIEICKNNAWEVFENCESEKLCKKSETSEYFCDNSQTTTCTEGEKRCQGNQIQECTSQNVWEDGEICNHGCDQSDANNVKCKCDFAARCEDDATLIRCDNGIESRVTCENDRKCKVNKFEMGVGSQAACVKDGDFLCKDEIVYRYNDSAWGKSFIDRGDIEAICGCENGEKRCLGYQIQECRNGAWQVPQFCDIEQKLSCKESINSNEVKTVSCQTPQMKVQALNLREDGKPVFIRNKRNPIEIAFDVPIADEEYNLVIGLGQGPGGWSEVFFYLDPSGSGDSVVEGKLEVPFIQGETKKVIAYSTNANSFMLTYNDTRMSIQQTDCSNSDYRCMDGTAFCDVSGSYNSFNIEPFTCSKCSLYTADCVKKNRVVSLSPSTYIIDDLDQTVEVTANLLYPDTRNLSLQEQRLEGVEQTIDKAKIILKTKGSTLGYQNLYEPSDYQLCIDDSCETLTIIRTAINFLKESVQGF